MPTRELAVVKVTNAELADKLDKVQDRLDHLQERLLAIEYEARVAKWVLRLLGAVFGSIVTYIIAHWKGSK